MIDSDEPFAEFDVMPARWGFLGVIDSAQDAVRDLCGYAQKLAADPEVMGDTDPNVNPYVQTLGGLAQLWEAPQLKDFPQKPSSLGQMLVLGGLGAAGGKLIGRGIDHWLPNDFIRAERAGMILGGLLGASPGLAGAYLNSQSGKPAWTTSFYNTKNASYATPWGESINVQQFQNSMWQDPRFVQSTPLALRAAASGLVQQAANIPGGRINSPFVTPADIARVAVGIGSGAASGWLVGKTLGAVFGTGQKTQDLLKNTGVAIGALKTVIPLVFGQEAFGYN